MALAHGSISRSPFLNAMFEFERDAQFLCETRPRLNASEERTAEKQLWDR